MRFLQCPHLSSLYVLQLHFTRDAQYMLFLLGQIEKCWSNITDFSLGYPSIYYKNLKKREAVLASLFSNWRRPTFPGSCPPSIIGANELNFCVRDGNRCILIAIVTRLVFGYRLPNMDLQLYPSIHAESIVPSKLNNVKQFFFYLKPLVKRSTY